MQKLLGPLKEQQASLFEWLRQMDASGMRIEGRTNSELFKIIQAIQWNACTNLVFSKVRVNKIQVFAGN